MNDENKKGRRSTDSAHQRIDEVINDLNNCQQAVYERLNEDSNSINSIMRTIKWTI